MRNPHLEIARTYWRKPLSPLGAGASLGEGAILMMLIGLVVLLISPKLLAVNVFVAFVSELVFAGPLLWLHFREQVVTEQRQIYPGFARPHVTVFAIVLLLLVIGWPLLMIARGAPPSMGVMGLSSIIMALIGWVVLRLSLSLFYAGIVGCCWLASQSGQAFIAPLLNGGNEPLAATLLLAGMVASAIAISCMIRLTEDDPGFRRIPLSGWNMRPRMTGDVIRTSIKSRPVEFMFMPGRLVIPATTGTSLWSRARRWRVLTRWSRWAIVFMGVMMVASISLGAGLLWMFFFCAPALMALARWQWILWRFLEADSLRPIARSAYISEIGLAIFLDLLRGWACVAVVIAATAYYWYDHSIWTVVAWIWLAFLLQLPVFGIGVWIMRYRSPITLLLACLTFMLPPVPALMSILLDSSSVLKNNLSMVLGIATLILPIIGLFLVRDAQRRWLVTELG